MATLDAQSLVTDILNALSASVGGDIKVFVPFAERQATALAKQAEWIAEETAAGQLTEDDRAWFLNDLATLSKNFAQVIAGLTALTIEKAWNAIVGAVWAAINAAVKSTIGIALPIPGMP
jgi:hypothetical protein